MPEGTVKHIFEHFIATISASSPQTHKTQNLFFEKFDATSEGCREKRKAKKEKARDNFWIKVPWRNPELQIFDMAAIISDLEVKSLYFNPDEAGKIKII